MDTVNQLSNFRPLGIALVVTILLFMIGAWSAAYFRQWPLPITIDRLQLGANATEMIRTLDPSNPPAVMVNAWSFWPHSLCILAAIALLGAALALAGVLPTLGWIITVLAVGGALVGLLVMHDWPPFMSYVILLVLAVGLIRTG